MSARSDCSPDDRQGRSITLSSLFLTPGRARVAVIVAALMFWELAARIYNDPDFFPPMTRTAVALVELLQRPTIWNVLGVIAASLLVGFVIALVAGTVLGMMIGRNRTAYLTFYPIVVLLYAIPQVTLLPLFVLAFGVGIEVKIVYGLTHGFFPIIVCVIAGTQNINPVLLSAARTMGASRRQILRRIVFPYIVPSLFTGMRLGVSAVLIGVILAELYASQRGVGYYIRHYSETFESQYLFALVALVSALGICLNELLRRAETHFSRWRQ